MLDMRRIVGLVFVLLLLGDRAWGTVQYARQTGQSCGTCHVDPLGGRKLTRQGQDFLQELRLKGLYRPLGRTQRLVRLVVGYVHMFFAILWFGTILYVHLLLKPAYAARGLPRGELLVGWVSIAALAITGTLLSIARLPTWQALWQSRFGLLLALKVGLFLLMVASACAVTFLIGPRLRRQRAQVGAAPKGVLSPAELACFDGQEGRAAYVAYQGVLYDVSKSRLWQGGVHLKKHHAGADLTEALKTAPHGEEVLQKMPVVGRLSEEAPRRPLHLRAFYFMAYFNLVLIFLVLLVISLWRWW
jgi:predicted heme/steroid binding protein